jgi:hypothetical protein
VASGSDPTPGPTKLKNPVSQLIMDTLNISPELTQLNKNKADLRMAYSKYLGILDTVQRLAEMTSDKTWTQKSTLTDVVEVFMSKTVYHRNPAKIFPLVSKYPLMEEWFLDPKNGPTTKEVWGDKKQTYENLSGILKSYTKNKGKGGSSVDRKGKKRQEDPSSEPEEEEIAKKKEKGKKIEGSNKKGSSSKSRY